MMPKIQNLGIRNITNVSITGQGHRKIHICDNGHIHITGGTGENSTVLSGPQQSKTGRDCDLAKEATTRKPAT
jgi:hypothetical protein